MAEAEMRKYKVLAQHMSSPRRITKIIDAHSQDVAELMAIRELADTDYYVLQAILVK